MTTNALPRSATPVEHDFLLTDDYEAAAISRYLRLRGLAGLVAEAVATADAVARLEWALRTGR